MRRAGIFGPVFTYESLIASRRWQVYAARAAFVALLLAAMASFWRAGQADNFGGWPTARQQLVIAGQRFFHAMVVVELILVLVAAPAATAGAICVDRSRGSLTHLLTTDLTDREIVLGKLAARLLPILALLACALPVSAIAVMLGGVEPMALASAFLVAVGIAVLGSALTMLLSAWGSKPHEVLSAVYLIWAAWILPWFILELLNVPATYAAVSVIRQGEPFWVALEPFNPYAGPKVEPSMRYALTFLAATLGVAAVLGALAVRSLRPSAFRAANRAAKPVVESRTARRFHRDVPWWPNPSLDGNPVLWREWHRSRPTKWMRVVWGIYLGMSGLASLACVGGIFLIPSDSWDDEIPAILVGMAAAFGLVLMSVTAATSLAEERSRGSLDVLMTTPMPSRSIVWGKWRGTFRLMPLVLFWPIVVGYALVVKNTPGAAIRSFYVLVPYGIAWAAFVTSLGLALACWLKRLGRALAASVAINVLLSIGVPLIIEATNARQADAFMPVSPFWGMAYLTIMIQDHGGQIDRGHMFASCAIWAAVYAALAALLLGAVTLGFDRALGRASERPRRAPSRSVDRRERPAGVVA